MLFSTNPKDMAIERMMTGVPHFPPRGHGTYVLNKFKYTAKDCDCRLCPHYSKKNKCKLPQCECIEERIEAEAIGYAEFMHHAFSEINISISDIADRELISRKMFGIICNAMAIRRYGLDAICILEKDGSDR